jgi:protein-disulfide isomerase
VALPQAPISLAGAFRKGSASASLAIVEYSDFSCPYCGQFARDTLPKIERAFVDTGLVLYVYRHLPLPIHPLAFGAAKAADCAGQQGKFWSMHDLLFANQGMLEPESLMVYSRNLGLDQELFRGCQQEITEPNVTADLGSARELQIAGTPTFLVGRVNKEEVTVLARLRGAVPFEKMRQTLEALQKSLTADTRR